MRVLGTLGVDSSTGEVLYQQSQPAVFAPTSAVVAFDQWNHFRLVLDFATDSYMGFVNGVNVVASHFVHDAGVLELDTFSDADIMAVAAEADSVSQGLTSTAVYDNFLVRDGLVGDYDLDGDVDNGDYSRWRMTFNQTVAVPGNNADGNKNGVVDAADYVVWRENLGASLFSNGLGSGLAMRRCAGALYIRPRSVCPVYGRFYDGYSATVVLIATVAFARKSAFRVSARRAATAKRRCTLGLDFGVPYARVSPINSGNL